MRTWIYGAICPVFVACFTGLASAQQSIDRTVLPIIEPDYESVTELDARKATAPPPFKVETPEGAPNE